MSYDRNNVFAKIIRGEIPSYKVFETDNVLAILDAFPCTAGHCLLIPKVEGYTNILDMPASVAAQLFQELPRLAKAVQEAFKCDGINIVQNNGGAAGQVVFHPHVHVIPRYEGDNLIRLPGGKEMIHKTEAQDVLSQIQKCL
ncbi:HIT domain-containing protein [Thraustotheca clavata]|uniref:HIT domain-containing protein n=1 Tax=Thraustotheca clavata TaxID=74557 RepID=A0A1V9ZQE9_9STRA|nr:HIT domain-containing protein [Thraustotheca clavata]